MTTIYLYYCILQNTVMAKGKNVQKEVKKAPAKTTKEKQAEKREKKKNK